MNESVTNRIVVTVAGIVLGVMILLGLDGFAVGASRAVLAPPVQVAPESATISAANLGRPYPHRCVISNLPGSSQYPVVKCVFKTQGDPFTIYVQPFEDGSGHLWSRDRDADYRPPIEFRPAG